MAGEKMEPIGGGFFVLVSNIHRFGTDAVLLADFSSVSKKETACDLCTGCGIIPMIWCRENRGKSITAVEIQDDAVFLLKQTIEINNVRDKVKVLHSDLRTLKQTPEFGAFDVVTVNPPYKPIGTGFISDLTGEQIVRHEVMCTLYDVVNTASRILKFGGRLCMCHRPERLCDIFEAMRAADTEPKKLRFVTQHVGSAPWLVLVEGRRGGKKGIKVLENLVIQDSMGNYTEDVKRMYGGFTK